MRHIFFGGIHPASSKKFTRRKPLMSLEVQPKEVVLPVDTSTGVPADVVVKPGDRVAVGQVVACANGEDSVAVHATVSGRVSAVELRPHPWMEDCLSVVIENDGKDTKIPAQTTDHNSLSQEELMGMIRQSGVVGMVGNPVPAHVKIQEARGRVDTLIINASECEPYLTADYRLILEKGRGVLAGARILSRVLGVECTVIASAGDKLNGIERLERTMNKAAPLREGERAITLRIVPNRFPLGAEKQIIQTITGREVPPGGDANDVGCVVINVATAYAIGQAVATGLPMTHRAVTVSGGAVERPRNLWVPIGTSLKDLLENAGGLREKPYVILAGGPMTGVAQTNLEAPILKNIGGVICLAPWEKQVEYPQTICLQCGHCIAACPMHLSPVLIYRALDSGNFGALEGLYPQDCIECGCCSYSCPSHMPLVDIIRRGASYVKEEGEKQDESTGD